MIRILKYGEVANEDIFARAVPTVNVEAIVTDIIQDVRQNGDEALYRYCEKFDGAKLESLQVSQEEIDEALSLVDADFLRILREAAENIRHFHEKQVRNSFIINDANGIVMGQKVIPVDRAGLYVPGGTAAYPSTVLMEAIPAKIAGCPEVVMVTPPGKDGKVNPVILAAASIAGVSRIFKLGGAQAVAALAYGTQSVPRVDKFVGPGNAFVAEAKRQVYGVVSIDMIAGPSEILIVADGRSDPRHVAADLLSQAEHDKLASAWLATTSEKLAFAVQAEVERQLSLLPREEIARTSIEENGRIIIVDSLETAAKVADEIAPEHLEVCVDDPFGLLPLLNHAGSIFLGRNCPEPLGDYLAGPNHTLPTSGTARYSSPLGVDDFCRRSSYIYYTREALQDVAEDVMRFAEREGLGAHANAVRVRVKE